MNLEKAANLTGAAVQQFMPVSVEIPLETKLPLYKRYIDLKAQEPESSYSTTIPIGTGIGATMGALIGRSTMSMGFGAIGGAIGGAMLTNHDNKEIKKAKKLTNRDMSDPILLNAMIQTLSNMR